MPAGAPFGNKNAANAKLWNAAIHRALDEKSRVDGKAALDALAMELIKKCQDGDLSALKEFGDRMDGKAHQSSDIDMTARVTEFIQGNKVYVGDSGEE